MGRTVLYLQSVERVANSPFNLLESLFAYGRWLKVPGLYEIRGACRVFERHGENMVLAVVRNPLNAVLLSPGELLDERFLLKAAADGVPHSLI